MSPLPINLPDRYQETGAVFSGGQGNVYPCQDTYLNRQVVVKTMRIPGDLAFLREEIRALSQIRSKHVAELYEVVEDTQAGLLGIILEFIPGADLTSFTAQGELHLLKVLYQISSGIADIHAAGLLHRDIKPKNMKFDSNNLIKLFDFGLSCDRDDAVTTIARGTRPFKAPELYGCPPISLTQSVDTYAFGVTTWLLMAQYIPWELKTAPPQQVRSFGTLPFNLSESIVELFDLTLEHDPNRRPSMAEIGKSLAAQLLQGSHQGTLVYRDTTRRINSTDDSVTIQAGNVGSVTIHYTGFDFRLVRVSGEVFVNGTLAVENTQLPDSCVLILGSYERAASRLFVTFDVSHPEVVL